MTAKEKTKTKGLGRGLSALLSSTDREYSDLEEGAATRPDRQLPIEFLGPNPYQPRKLFDEEKARDLVDSIKEKGILQPILVRERAPESFEIIAGERRWRAAQAAGLHEVPVIIRDFSDGEALEIAIIENIQRHDLSPIEEAAGYQRLMDEFHHTQEQLGRIVGKSRSHIANILRLLTLPDAVREMLADGLLSMGHARALITAEAPEKLARRIVAEGLSVRQAEQLAKRARDGAGAAEDKKAPPAGPVRDADTLALEQELSAGLGLKVTVAYQGEKKGGEVRIRYRNLEQLDDICARLSRAEEI